MTGPAHEQLPGETTAPRPEWQDRVELETAGDPTLLKEYGERIRIKVDAGLHWLQGNDRPYFSVTGEIYRRGAADCESCGCLHDEIARHWPALEPVIALHLSTDEGQPMHAESNGWYWLAGYLGGLGEQYHGSNSTGNSVDDRSREYCLGVFADHVRITTPEAQALADGWERWAKRELEIIPIRLRPHSIGVKVRGYLGLWITAQGSRWQAEADAARVILRDLRATTPSRRIPK